MREGIAGELDGGARATRVTPSEFEDFSIGWVELAR